jgi:hypothetical protein
MKHARSGGPCTASALLALLALFAGCQKETRTPSAERAPEQRPAPGDTASLTELTGIWTVVGHHIPGISAMSDSEATAWHGRTVRLTAKEAVSGESHCDAPSYLTRTIPKDNFLSVEYKLPPGALAPLASRENVTVLDVSCGGNPWTAMGDRLIEIDGDRALAPWDGVFFELTRYAERSKPDQ